MNERIRELAEQAEEYSYIEYSKKETGYNREHFFIEKFAELIIQECCVTADANVDDSKYPSYHIRRKFGVE